MELDKTFSEIVKRLNPVLVTAISVFFMLFCGFVLFAPKSWLERFALDSLPALVRLCIGFTFVAGMGIFVVSLPITWIAYRRQRMEDNRKRERGRQIRCAIRRSQSEAMDRDKDDPAMG